jgi:hypothetical protein
MSKQQMAVLLGLNLFKKDTSGGHLLCTAKGHPLQLESVDAKQH